MHELSENANKDLVKNVDFSDVGLLVEIGGGDGTNVIEIAKNFSNLKAAVFDLPSVCPIAENKIETSGFQNRLKVIPGNCFFGSF